MFPICKCFFQYVSDLLESYMKGANYQQDSYFKSWTHVKRPERAVIEVTVRGICHDLPRTNDGVVSTSLSVHFNVFFIN